MREPSAPATPATPAPPGAHAGPMSYPAHGEALRRGDAPRLAGVAPALAAYRLLRSGALLRQPRRLPAPGSPPGTPRPAGDCASSAASCLSSLLSASSGAPEEPPWEALEPGRPQRPRRRRHPRQAGTPPAAAAAVPEVRVLSRLVSGSSWRWDAYGKI